MGINGEIDEMKPEVAAAEGWPAIDPSDGPVKVEEVVLGGEEKSSGERNGHGPATDHGDVDVKDLFSGSTPPPPRSPRPGYDGRSASRSRSRSGSPGRRGVKEEKDARGALGKSSSSTPARSGPILIDDLPTAWEEAHETFTSLEKCVYERKDLGLSRESDEMMVCDCVFDKRDDDCINRALFIECLAGECRAKGQCRNQRFTKKEYAPIDIVLTEMKGYGLRAAKAIPSGSLIYEYIGEVVKETTFRKRMQQYADEGIRHFYFMMLQKEEYIDATKKGGIGRFANHSCDPNCEVQKWVVGRRLRMGIFSKRDILKGEEITFNYNVDRYGHDAQICYCGEPNCVGFIGGKTQTDSSLGTMNDLFLDALGIADEVEALQLKGNKKKKSKQLDEDFIPTLRPITEPESQKVAAAMRQSVENPKMMTKLLERISMTGDMTIHRQLMRLHGFGLMKTILTQMADERSVVLLALESMAKWKTTIRTKIEDSGIEEPVKELRDGDDKELQQLADDLLTYWSTLESPYRIAKKAKITSLDEEDEAETTTIAESNTGNGVAYRPSSAWEEANRPISFTPRPRFQSTPRPRPPPPPPPQRQPSHPSKAAAEVANRSALDAIIAQAQQAALAQAAAAASAAAAESPAAESSRSGSGSAHRAAEDDYERQRKRQRRMPDPEEAERKKEKELKRLVGEVVVKSMTKYKEQMDHDTFKRYARECTELLVDKEKKGHSYAAHRHPSLTEEKKAKMKAFTKEFVHKVLKRLKEKGKLRSVRHRTSSTSAGTSGLGMTSDTPGATPATTDGSSVMPTTPSGHGDEGDLVDDLFGVAEDREDDVEMEMDLDGDSEMGQRTPADKRPHGVGRMSGTPRSASGSMARTSPLGMSPISTPVFEKEGWLGSYGHAKGTEGGDGDAQGVRNGQTPATPTANMPFGGIGVGVVKVDSFRPSGQ